MGRGRKPGAGGVERGNGYTPPPPAGMSRASLAKWHAIVPLVAQLVQLQEADADSLRQYCDASVLRDRAQAEIDGGNEPLLEQGPNGARYPNPLFKIVGDSEKVMQRLAERFGLDPASRKRLAIEAAKAQTAFGDFLKGRERAKPETIGG